MTDQTKEIGSAAGRVAGALLGGLVAGIPGAAAGALIGTPVGSASANAIRSRRGKPPPPTPPPRPGATAGAPSGNPRYAKRDRVFPGFYREGHRVPSGFGPFYSYSYYPYDLFPYSYYYQNTAEPTGIQPTWYRSYDCPAPMTPNCRRLSITARWAASCFMPRYQRLRRIYGDDYVSLASAIARQEMPGCPFPPRTAAAVEFERRVALAVTVLLNAQGHTVPMPRPAPTPRPRQADRILQPWMRALMTGWL